MIKLVHIVYMLAMTKQISVYPQTIELMTLAIIENRMEASALTAERREMDNHEDYWDEATGYDLNYRTEQNHARNVQLLKESLVVEPLSRAMVNENNVSIGTQVVYIADYGHNDTDRVTTNIGSDTDVAFLGRKHPEYNVMSVNTPIIKVLLGLSSGASTNFMLNGDDIAVQLTVESVKLSPLLTQAKDYEAVIVGATSAKVEV